MIQRHKARNFVNGIHKMHSMSKSIQHTAEEKVRRYIAENNLYNIGHATIATVSGGADSICLASMLKRLGIDFFAVHCNFHLRGEESMRDEKFVEDFCKRNDIKLFKTDFETEKYASEKHISIEMAARELRYAYFEEIRKNMGAESISVAHHRDDNVETFLLNVTRGTGIRGAGSIKAVNNRIVRPMLCLSREEILEYLKEIGETYVTDSTNLECDFSRNKIRLKVIPLLKEINPAAQANIAQTIENMNEVLKIYDQYMKEHIQQCCTEKDGTFIINKKKLSATASPTSVLHEIIYPLGFTLSQEKDIIKNMDDRTGAIFSSSTHTLLLDRESIIIEPSSTGNEEIFDIEISDTPTSACIKQWGQMDFVTVPIEEVVIEKDCSKAFFDAEKLGRHLTIRSVRTGDAFQPFGMKGKKKLVSDYMTDVKMNRFEKERQQLLISGKDIAWVIGRRSSDKFRIDENTTHAVIVSFKKE